jgi:hypothetical protein
VPSFVHSDRRGETPRQPSGDTHTPLYCTILFAILIAYHACLYFLWSARASIYFGWMKFLGVGAWKFPFLDLIGVLSWGDCHAAGIDVLQANPCDPLNRLLAYSPMLLDLHLDWIGVAHATSASLIADLAFLVALTLVLRPRSRRTFAVAVLACLSPAVLFAIERANFDVFEFVLIAGGAFLAVRGAVPRFLSYVVFLLAGLLKFYPLVVLVLIARERLRLALAYGSAAVAIMIWFAVHYWNELIRLREGFLGPVPFGDRFGGATLPFGVVDLLRLPHAVGWFLYALLLGLMLYAAFRLARRLGPALPGDWQTIDHFLLALGSLLVVGCFVAGPSYGYRASLLVFVIPGLLALSASVRDRGAHRILAAALVGVLCCLWRHFFESGLINLGLLDTHSLSGLVFLVLREAVWWATMSVLASFIVLFIAQSPAWRDLMALRERGPMSRAAGLS